MAAVELAKKGATVILTVLFLAQRFGTGKVGRLFGPVMVLWFAALSVAGLRQIVAHPIVHEALQPDPQPLPF